MEKKKKSNGRKGSEPEKNNTEKSVQNNPKKLDNENNKEKKIPRWKIKKELESKINVLKKKQHALVRLLIAMFEIGVNKKLNEGISDPIIKLRHAHKTSKLNSSTSQHWFSTLFKGDKVILNQVENSPSDKDYTMGRFSSTTYDNLKPEIEAWYNMGKHDLVNEYDLLPIKKLDELLGKFYGL